MNWFIEIQGLRDRLRSYAGTWVVKLRVYDVSSPVDFRACTHPASLI